MLNKKEVFDIIKALIISLTINAILLYSIHMSKQKKNWFPLIQITSVLNFQQHWKFNPYFFINIHCQFVCSLFHFANLVCWGNTFPTVTIPFNNEPSFPSFNSSVYLQKKMFSVNSNNIGVKPSTTIKIQHLFLYKYSLEIFEFNEHAQSG